nr:MAG TPA: hypothetical protein [Caudoviricetes sp.]
MVSPRRKTKSPRPIERAESLSMWQYKGTQNSLRFGSAE